MRERVRVPVVVQGRASRRRAAVGRGLWVGAELAVTFGLVVLLLVVHQLWWTNQQARADADRTVRSLVEEWSSPPPVQPAPTEEADFPSVPPDESGGTSAPPAPGADRSTPRWDRAYAILRIPKIGVTAPVAQGIGKRNVLDKGYVGHYPGTAQPGAIGNFALAGHRNTHGEPFRRINRLGGGDLIQVETREKVYSYVVDRTLPQTSPRDGGVIAGIPRSLVKPGHGYSEPGSYLTLTTCTPEFTSTYRLVVWAKLTGTRSR